MDIQVKSLQKRLKLKPTRLIKLIQQILKTLRIQQAELAFVFVSRQKIQSLNKQFLKRSYATDVLSFDLSDKKKKGVLIGDIIISTDEVVKNAKMYNNSLSQELALYIVHGILHLNGYDDHRPRDIQRMREAEEKILKILGNTINNIVSN